MASNKSPGIDGLPPEFYRKFFDLIGPDLLEVYSHIFHDGFLSKSQRTCLVVLLPKNGDPLNPANRRPISLLCTDYKILSKMLQARLSKALPNLINVYQTCGIPGRSIHHNLFIVRDICAFVRERGSCCALLSLDQEKAFDKVDWAFLLKVLKQFNFGENFCKWIKILYNNISSRILINGNLTNDVRIERGVRQGCPLSPLLYVLFIEPLAGYIAASPRIRGFPIPGTGGKVVKFLQYADDATCVATSAFDIKGFLSAFEIFQRATGASVNLAKSMGLKLGGFVG